MRYGCLGFIGVFVLGSLVGYAYGVWEDRFETVYIDRHTAIQYGLENAQAHCRDQEYTHPVDCRYFTLTDVEERTTGWFLTFMSADRRRTDTMWIGRRGEYDSTGRTNLDDPEPSGRVQKSPAPMPSAGAAVAPRPSR